MEKDIKSWRVMSAALEGNLKTYIRSVVESKALCSGGKIDHMHIMSTLGDVVVLLEFETIGTEMTLKRKRAGLEAVTMDEVLEEAKHRLPLPKYMIMEMTVRDVSERDRYSSEMLASMFEALG